MGFTGCVDEISETCISGWAAETEDLAAPVSVDIWINGNLVATVCCTEFREDLPAAGIGDGHKAFHYDPRAHLRPGRNALEVRYAGTDRLVYQGWGEWTIARQPADTPDRALLAALEAYHEFTPRDHICWIGQGGEVFGKLLAETQVPHAGFSACDTADSLPAKADLVIWANCDDAPAGKLQHLLDCGLNYPGLLVAGFRESAAEDVSRNFTAAGIAGVRLESIAPWYDAANGLCAFLEVRRARPLLAHIHVPKCAGTSLRILLQRYFNARHLCLYVDDTYFVYGPEALRSYLMQNPDAAGFSSHHVRMFPRWMAGRRMLYITFLRDPVEQFVSYMTHIKKYYATITSASLLDSVPLNAPEMPLREFARWLLTQERDVPFRENHNVNFFVRHNHPQAPDRLAAAKTALQEFFFVGIAERMEESMTKLRILTEAAGIDFPPEGILFENISNDYRDDLSWIRADDEVGRMLLASVEKDRQLYDWAAARLDTL